MFRTLFVVLCAAAAVLGEPVAVPEPQPTGPKQVRVPSGGRARQGAVSPRSLFGLVARSGCDGTSTTGPTCPQGKGCCYVTESCCGDEFCLVEGETCCDSGKYSCVTGESCCGGGCMPDDAVCCGDGTYSDFGQSGCGTNEAFTTFGPGPTFTNRYGKSGTSAFGAATFSALSFSSFTYSTPTLAAGGAIPTYTVNGNSGGCAGSQKVINGGAANKGGGGHSGSSGGSSGSSGDSGSSSSGSDGSSSGGSSGSSGGGSSGNGCQAQMSSSPAVVLSMGTLIGASLFTILLL